MIRYHQIHQFEVFFILLTMWPLSIIMFLMNTTVNDVCDACGGSVAVCWDSSGCVHSCPSHNTNVNIFQPFIFRDEH